MTNPSNDGEIVNRIRFELDESQRKRVTKALREVRNDAREIITDQDAKQLGERFAKVAKSVGLPRGAVLDLRKDIKDLGLTESQLKAVSSGFLDVYSSADKATKQVRELSKIELRQQAFDQTSRNVALAGDVQSNLGALNALSGGRLGAAGEVVALAEELPRLKQALSGLPSVISNAAATLGPSGIAIGVALAAVGIALSQFVTDAQNESQRLQDLFKQSLDFETDLNQGNITQSDFDSQLSDAQAAYDTALQALADAESDAAQIFDRTLDNASDLGVFGEGIARLGFAVSDLANLGDVDAAQENIRIAQAAVNETGNTVEVLSGFLGDSRIAADEAADAENNLAQARDKAAAQIDQLTALEKQAADVRSRFEQSARDREQDARTRRLDEVEDFENARIQRETQQNKAIESLKEASNKRIKDIESDIADLPLKRAKELKAAEQDAADERSKLLKKFADESTKDREALNLKLSRIDRDGVLKRARQAQDDADNLNELAAEGSVKAFIKAQREQEKQLSRSLQDDGIKTGDLVQDFQIEREQKRQALEEQTADLATELSKQQLEIRTSYAERRAELGAALKAEQVQLKEAISASTQAYLDREGQINAARELAQQRRERDEAIAEARRQRALRNELNNINERIRKIFEETGATRALSGAVRELGGAINTILSQVRAIGGRGSTTTSGYGSGRAGASSGGVSSGYGFGFGSPYTPVASGSQNITVNFAPQTTVGDIPSHDYIDNSMGANFAKLINQIKGATATGRYG